MTIWGYLVKSKDSGFDLGIIIRFAVYPCPIFHCYKYIYCFGTFGILY